MYKNGIIKIVMSLDGIDVVRISVMGSLSCQTSFHVHFLEIRSKVKCLFLFLLKKIKMKRILQNEHFI